MVTKKATKAPTKPFKVGFAITGSAAQNISVKPGATFQLIVDHFNLAGCQLKVSRGGTSYDITNRLYEPLQPGDTVIAVTAVKPG